MSISDGISGSSSSRRQRRSRQPPTVERVVEWIRSDCVEPCRRRFDAFLLLTRIKITALIRFGNGINFLNSSINIKIYLPNNLLKTNTKVFLCKFDYPRGRFVCFSPAGGFFLRPLGQLSLPIASIARIDRGGRAVRLVASFRALVGLPLWPIERTQTKKRPLLVLCHFEVTSSASSVWLSTSELPAWGVFFFGNV